VLDSRYKLIVSLGVRGRGINPPTPAAIFLGNQGSATKVIVAPLTGVWYGNGMKIKDMAEAQAALEAYYGITEKVMGKDITVERMQRLMAYLGNPERQLKIIHVAGTSGKTSTTYYIAGLLCASGYKVGHTVSPHVDSITERVQLNGKSISEKKFCKYLGEFLDLIESTPETPTWFECLIAFAIWVFVQEKVDYAVLETGLGGLGDATNVAERADKLCVITDIGFDHMHVLGDKITSIAYQKAGIIHSSNTALMYTQDAEVMRVVRYWVSQQEDADLLTFEQGRLAQVYGGKFAAGLPDYQRRNWLLAFAAYLYLAKRDELKVITVTEMQHTQTIQIPGRMDARRVGAKTIIMDGAHNEQKMAAFVKSFQLLQPGRKVPVLLALKQGKEVRDIAPLLSVIASEIIVTTFSKAQDLPILSIDPVAIVEALRAQGIHAVASSNQHKAYQQFLAAVDDVGIVTGSFFLISELREHEKLV
jgi:dihydrofolate synthase/folylpolyglutamate synthase